MVVRLIIFIPLLLLLAACSTGVFEEPPDEYAISQEPTPAPTEETGQAPAYESGSDIIPFSLEDFSQSELDNLPMWLSVGLDLYLLGESAPVVYCGVETAHRMMTEELPGFGDAWFIPGFIPETNHEKTYAVALAFVQHISSAGSLRDFVMEHTNRRNMREAEALSANIWSEFTGGLNSDGFGIRYERGRVHRVEGSPLSPFGIVLSVRSNYAVYHFGHEQDNTPEQWTIDMVNHHVAIGEESIRFVSDWLGVEPSRQFDVYMIHVDERFGSGGGYGNGILANFQDISSPPWAMAHEAVHALLSAANIRNNFPQVYQPVPHHPGNYMITPFFEEGLCIMLELFFEVATENERFAMEAAWRRRNFFLRAFGELIEKDTPLTLEEVRNYINAQAILWLDYVYEPGDTDRFGTRYTLLNMHETAASFMLYLYTERGTREDLLRAYQNINLMYEIYGANMEGMIQSWLIWLDSWR
ncbi:MAG: hypothetical protein FWC20_06425 [Oscillospiraceae bacterium]|nr:hypothetical protein [Oscillospiraceae bacterium]